MGEGREGAGAGAGRKEGMNAERKDLGEEICRHELVGSGEMDRQFKGRRGGGRSSKFGERGLS